MKKESINQFNDALNLDLHPMVTPNSVLTDNLNGTFITYNGNEFCLQNDRGNHSVAKLSEGYVPIGAKEYNGVIYIVSVKPSYENPEAEEDDRIIKEEDCETEIGTYPGVDWNVAYEEEHNLNYNEYTPLKNIDVVTDNDDNVTSRGSFSGLKLGYTTQTPVTIEIQPSYDGSVNLILTDGKNPVRMINSGFSVTSDKYKLIERNGDEPINQYDSDKLSSLTLIRNSNFISNVELKQVIAGGQLKGGNYTLYIKFGDDDFNQTDVVAESGIISVFKGNDYTPYTISGTLLDERTDKKINVEVTNVDTQYSKIYIYFSREYSDTLGYRLTEYGMFKSPFNIDKSKSNQEIWLTGFEQVETINREEINIDYHTIDFARAEAQQQSMLFLGNVGQKETFDLYRDLQDRASQVVTKLKQDSLGTVSSLYNKDVGTSINNSEYYSTHNIYYKLGYWPNEWYRFGVVFILNDGSTTPVFNIPGGHFTKSGSEWTLIQWSSEVDKPTGVFKTPDVQILNTSTIQPLYFCFEMTDLSDLPVSGYFYVRQKRIPTIICQGLRIGVDKRSHLPITWNGHHWITQSFLSLKRWNIADNENKNLPDNNSGIMPKLEYYNKSILPDLNLISFYGLLDSIAYLDEFTINDTIEEWNTEYADIINSGKIIYADDFINDIENTSIYTYKFINKYKYTTGSRSNSGRGDGNSSVEPGSFQEIDPEEFYYVTYSTQDLLPEFIQNKICWDIDLNTAYNKALTEQSNRIDSSHMRSIHQTNAEQQKVFQEKYIVYDDTNENSYNYGLLSLDPAVVASVRNILDGSEFELVEEYDTTTLFGSNNTDYPNLSSTGEQNDSYLQIYDRIKNKTLENSFIAQCIFIPENTKIKTIGSAGFSNVAGNSVDISQYSYSSQTKGVKRNHKNKKKSNNDNRFFSNNLSSDYNTIKESEVGVNDITKIGFNSVINVNILRGIFTPYIGVTGNLKHGIYSIKLKSVSDDNAITVRKQDESPYYAVGRRIKFNNKTVNIYSGDCFTNTVSMRVLRNFIDSDAPISDNIVDFDAWNYYIRSAGDKWDVDPENQTDWEKERYPKWDEVNKADVNTVDLGYWVTFKCLSSYNLGLRAEDRFDEQSLSLMGNPKSFFPLNGGSTATGTKVGESFLLNDGYSATVSEKTYDLLPDVPYTRSEFANRIIFSNVQVDDSFVNGYRTFQGLSYKDYDKQYGAIVKLVPWDNNLLVVMEHGIGLVGVNEQALLQTNTADTIHIYGHGVLSDHMQIISPDYGSKYEHSVIRTPIGVYGIDADARKIWRVSTQKGFETLSDMKIESYLNDKLPEVNNEGIEMEICDIRTHYNETKGDVMFTFFKRRKTKKSVESKRKASENINTSQINMKPGETVNRYFTVDKDTTVTSTGPATIEQTDNGIKVTSETYGDGKITISTNDGKETTIDYKIQSPDEAEQERQEEIKEEIKESLDDLTINVTESGPLTIKVGDTKLFKVTLNKNNIGLSDLKVLYDPKILSYTINGDHFVVTGIKAGSSHFQLSYGDKKSTEFSLVVNEKIMSVTTSENNTTRALNDTDSLATKIVGVYESLHISDVTGKLTISVSDSSKIKYVSRNNGITLQMLAAGNPVVTIKDDKRTVKVIVPIVDDIPLTDVNWSIGSCNDPGFIGTNANITMHVGESIKYTFDTIPTKYNRAVYSYTHGITASSIGYIESALTGALEKNTLSCRGTRIHGPWLEIKAKKVGRGTVQFTLWKASGKIKSIVKRYNFNVTVVK